MNLFSSENKFIKIIINIFFVAGWYIASNWLTGLLCQFFYGNYCNTGIDPSGNGFLIIVTPCIFGFGVYFASKYVWSDNIRSNKLSNIFLLITIILGIFMIL